MMAMHSWGKQCYEIRKLVKIVPLPCSIHVIIATRHNIILMLKLAHSSILDTPSLSWNVSKCFHPRIGYHFHFFGNFPFFGKSFYLNWIEYPNYGNSFGFNWIQYPNNGNSFRFNWIQYPNNGNGFPLNCIQYPNNGYISVYPKWISVRSDYIVWEGD